MLDLLFLLLPIAAAYGWYMGRYSVQQEKKNIANRLSREYVKGVNFLLADQQDKAVDLFTRILKNNNDTMEAHLILGNLFRFRGELDRAIHIHQSLLESATLAFDQRLLVIQQLGRDYMAAGLLDRAEEMFNQLVDEKDFKIYASQQLLQIYQSISDWNKSIFVAKKLVKLGQWWNKNEIAHFYCELALQALTNNDFNYALKQLRRAFIADKNCVRVSIMKGRIFVRQKDFIKAVASFTRILEQDKEMVSEVLSILQECYSSLEDLVGWEVFLRRCIELNCGTGAILFFADMLKCSKGLEMALRYISSQLSKFPTMALLHRMITYCLLDVEEGRKKESLVLLQNVIEKQIHTQPRYRCVKCGFTTKNLHWRCPSCRFWSTIKPIREYDVQ